MVRQAFHLLAPEKKSRLICFSDDMDGFRKVPDNIPNGDLLVEYLEKPLTAVPDPFENMTVLRITITRGCKPSRQFRL